MKKAETIEEYIAGYPPDIQMLLVKVRSAIIKAAPAATEVISYGMPAFKLNGMLVWFAAHSKHIGFYPGASGIAVFKNEISVYKNAKGSVQFPFDKPLPLKLITKIVKYKVKENIQNAQSKSKSSI